jgi:tRNA-specific 2-thiouridylase
MKVKKPNLIKYAEMPEDIDIVTKIRYKDKGTLSKVKNLDDNLLEVTFYEPVQGIAPGQSAVFYEGNDLLGGGFISHSGE